MKITKQFILDSLLKYKENPKLCGYSDNACKYFTDDGRNCAIGQYMKKSAIRIYEVKENEEINNILNNNIPLEKIFKKEYLPIFENEENFTVLNYMQNYHDTIAQGFNYLTFIVDKLEELTKFNLEELR